jgi:hypothetical protein
MGIGVIRLPKLGTHTLLLHKELGAEHDEYQDKTDDSRTCESAIAVPKNPVRMPV